MLEFDEFKDFVTSCKIDLDKGDILTVFNLFDINGDKSISYNEFLRFLRGELSQKRRILILKAYKRLDPEGKGYLGIDELKKAYKHHSKTENVRKI